MAEATNTDALRIAELEKALAAAEKARAKAEAIASTGKSGFTVRGPRPLEQARAEIKAARSSKPKTYRALEEGVDYRQGLIPAGKVFTTDQPKGAWMEEVTAKELKAEEEAEADA